MLNHMLFIPIRGLLKLAVYLNQSQSITMDTPKFSSLPNIPDGPKGCAWAVWNKIHEKLTGTKEKDMLGTLNHLTPTVVAEAGAEIKTGERVALKYVIISSSSVQGGR